MDAPIAKGESLNLTMCPKIEEETQQIFRILYSNAVVSLMYEMICTRHDIVYIVGLVSRFESNPGMAHWKAMKKILRYLKGTTNYSIFYQANDLKLVVYMNADWGGDLDERKSISRYIFLLNEGVISWTSKKHTCVALSTIEAEFVASTNAAQGAIWFRRFLNYKIVTIYLW